jgi:hypothetical protein
MPDLFSAILAMFKIVLDGWFSTKFSLFPIAVAILCAGCIIFGGERFGD